MDAWPLSFKQSPEREYNLTPACGLSSGEDELSQRRTRTYPEFKATFTFKQCTAAQLQTLKIFYNTTLNQTKPFTAPWLASAGFTHHFCVFASAPSAQLSGYGWDISISLILIATVPLDDEGVVVYGEVY